MKRKRREDPEAVLQIEGDSFGQSYTLNVRLSFIERLFILFGLPYFVSGIEYVPKEAYPQPRTDVIFLRLEVKFLSYGKRKITTTQAVDCDAPEVPPDER